jgi:diacylglycerol kinase (ATP)
VTAGESVFVLVNPVAGRGRGAKVAEALLAALDGHPELAHAWTSSPGDESRLAEEAIGRGVRTVVAVGGDGTWGNVADAIVRSGAPVRMGLVPAGTGSDFAKSVGIPPHDLAACAAIIRAGRGRLVDVGRIEQKCFLNVAGFGYDVAVIEHTWRVQRLKGRFLYLYCALQQLHRFRGFPVEIEADGQPWGRHDLLMLMIANGRIFGGTFAIAPDADVGDGALDLSAFHNMTTLRRLGVLLRILRGTHAAHPAVSTLRASRLRLRFAEPPAYETDGDCNRAASAEVEVACLPRALEILVPPA